MSRNEFLDYVKEKCTAESNLNEELVAKTIDFAGVDLKRKEEIAATIADNFTKEEIKKMTAHGDVKVIHGNKVVNDRKADGAHLDRTKDEPTEILLDKEADKTAITHEFVHLLRSEDKDRKGLTRTAYDLDDDGYVIGDSKTDENTYAEECAVIAETEIRAKEATRRPNSYLNKLDQEPIVGESETMEWYDIERRTMRTKADSIKTKEKVPVYSKIPDKDVMAEGVNLRGEKALQMFERNFKRARLGNAAYQKYRGAKTNIQTITDNNKKKKKKDAE